MFVYVCDCVCVCVLKRITKQKNDVRSRIPLYRSIKIYKICKLKKKSVFDILSHQYVIIFGSATTTPSNYVLLYRTTLLCKNESAPGAQKLSPVATKLKGEPTKHILMFKCLHPPMHICN